MEQVPLIVGSGPTGLAAALFLADAGIRCRIVERGLTPSSTSRAQVVNPRTLELLESTGVTEAILTEARPIHRVVFYEQWEPLAELEFGHAHPQFPMVVLPQARSEALLLDALAAREIEPERGVELTSFSQDDDGVDACSPGRIAARISARRCSSPRTELTARCGRRSASAWRDRTSRRRGHFVIWSWMIHWIWRALMSRS